MEKKMRFSYRPFYTKNYCDFIVEVQLYFCGLHAAALARLLTTSAVVLLL